MLAVKARFDGKRIVLPEEARGAPPGNVIVIFEADNGVLKEQGDWMKAQEAAFAKAWENDEDAAYDSM